MKVHPESNRRRRKNPAIIEIVTILGYDYEVRTTARTEEI